MTRGRLVREILRDLVTDVRCAERDGLPEYAAKCRREIAILYAMRHTARLGSYGWPRVPFGMLC
jgi:hypothetical protein